MWREKIIADVHRKCWKKISAKSVRATQYAIASIICNNDWNFGAMPELTTLCKVHLSQSGMGGEYSGEPIGFLAGALRSDVVVGKG